VEQPDVVELESTGESLIRQRRVQITVAENVRSGSERGLDQLPQVLRPVGDVEAKLGQRLDPGDLAARRSPRRRRPRGEPPGSRVTTAGSPHPASRSASRVICVGLSRAFDPFERDETAVAPRRREEAGLEARRRAERGLDRLTGRRQARGCRVVVGIEDLVVRAHGCNFSDASA